MLPDARFARTPGIVKGDIFFDPELRTSLIEKGRERRKMFTWQNSADQLWEVIEKVLNDKK